MSAGRLLVQHKRAVVDIEDDQVLPDDPRVVSDVQGAPGGTAEIRQLVLGSGLVLPVKAVTMITIKAAPRVSP